MLLTDTILGRTTLNVLKTLLRCLVCWWVLSVPTLVNAAVETAAKPDEVWLVVDTRDLVLTVMRQDKSLKVFDNIAIGSNGPTWQKRQRDQKTPLGDFTITEIRKSNNFRIFMAIDYPNRDHVERARAENRIDGAEYAALRYALDRGDAPPQNTSLGGHLGIHGVGKGSAEIHQSVNWTDGCIALSNEQLEELKEYVGVGTRVKVH